MDTSTPIVASVVAVILTVAGVVFAFVVRGSRSASPPSTALHKDVAAPIIETSRLAEASDSSRRLAEHAAHIDEVKIDSAKPVEDQGQANADWVNGKPRRRF